MRPWELGGLGLIDTWTMTSIVWPNDPRLEMAKQRAESRGEVVGDEVPDEVADAFSF